MTRRTILQLASAVPAVAAVTGKPYEIPDHAVFGQRELFVDNFLVERFIGGAQRRLHAPERREVALIHDAPWEGNSCVYHTVIEDGGLFRMWYKGVEQSVEKNAKLHPAFTCYAESRDGIHWQKPDLGLVEFNGSKHNNIVWSERGESLTPFRDANPSCSPDARYKAVVPHKGALMALKSPDGIHWSPLREEPVITNGAFDSQNLAFWDTIRGEYRAYFRHFRKANNRTYRDILTATSRDFLNWTEAVWLQYPGAPDEELYTNQIDRYHRAPHIFFGFPTRYIDRSWSESMRLLPDLEGRTARARNSRREGTALTDGLFMTSRDGRSFERWDEAFLRPGPFDNWVYGDNYQNWGLIETRSSLRGAPDELSLYATENYWRPDQGSHLRRFTIRMDGFVSVHSGGRGGEVVTRPLVFRHPHLLLNYATSAAGGVRVELQQADGTAIPGYTLAECPVIFGDHLTRPVHWNDKQTVADLAGKPVRLRFELRDADLYSLCFTDQAPRTPPAS